MISVIIPVLNEGARIRRHLEKVCGLPGLHEIIVVDGGSTDDTALEARAFPRVRWLSAPRGRALQQNAAARMAEGDVLLFLHADVELPEDAAAQIETAMESGDVVAGAFRTWTVSDSKRRWPGLLLHLADVRSRYTGLPYGDQALFVRADAFHRVGGFPEQPLMEDLELSRRLSRIGRIMTVPARVLVSGRRFEARILYYALAINLFPFLYKIGVSPSLLARFYGHVR
jgi:rSAM/selenodomain-associated transferase 2